MRSPYVQNYLSRNITLYLSRELGTVVEVKGVNFGFFLDVILEGVRIQDRHNNTLIAAKTIHTRVNFIDFANQKITIGKTSLDSASITLAKYRGEKGLNFQFIVDYFSGGNKKKSEGPGWGVQINSVELTRSRFCYLDSNAPEARGGMDYGDIDASKIELLVENLRVNGDTIRMNVRRLSAEEKCGLILRNFSTELTIAPSYWNNEDVRLTTAYSDLQMDLRFSFSSWTDFDQFEQNVRMDASIDSGVLNTRDLGYFAPELASMKETISIQGQVTGRVDSLATRNLKLEYGDYTAFNGDIVIRGLPEFKTSIIKAQIRSFQTSTGDLSALQIPDGEGGLTFIAIPAEVRQLGNIWLTGNFEGYYNDFDADARLICDLGNMNAQVHMKGNETQAVHFYSGHVSSTGFNVGGMINSGGLLGSVALEADIDGSGFTPESANLTIKGKIHSITFKDYAYKNLDVDGKLAKSVFNGTMDVNDDNLALHFEGSVDFNDSIPVYLFTSSIYKAHLNKINLLHSDSISDLQCRLSASFSGNNADNLTGSFSIEDATYKDGGKTYQLDILKVTAFSGLLNKRLFTIHSDYVDAEFKGTFFFEDIVLSTKQFIVSYLPGITFKNDSLDKPTKRQDFTFHLKFYNASPVLKYFIPDIQVSPQTELSGSYDSGEKKLFFDLYSNELTYQKIVFSELYCRAQTKNNSIVLTSGCSSVLLTDTAHIDSIRMKSIVTNDSINFLLNWRNSGIGPVYAGHIEGYALFESGITYIGTRPSWFTLYDSTWNIYSGGNMIIDTSGVITVPGLYFTSQNQRLEAKGRISGKRSDKLRINFINLNLNDFDYITEQLDFNLDGIIDGYFDLYSALDNPAYTGNIHIKDLAFNGPRIGDASVICEWDDNKKGIYISTEVLYVGNVGTTSPVDVEGYFYPDSKTNNFDLKIDINNFILSSLSRYMEGIGEIKDGKASGHFTLTGLTSDPELNGRIKLMRTFFHVDYLNTTYGTNHEGITVDKYGFNFKDMVLIDQEGNNRALCNGRISHKKFKNWAFDLLLEPENLLCMNTSSKQNELFYGKAFASGKVHILGDEKNMSVDMDIKTEKNTVLYIPMDYASEVSDNSFIVFVGADGQVLETDESNGLTGVSINGKFEVTDQTEVQIIFDPLVGDLIRGRGNGNIEMQLTPDGTLRMSGDYTIKSGDYLFTFENVLNKRFTLQEGGTIRWTGDPYDADMDIRAIYHLRASLASLGYGDSKGSVPVDCIINMSGRLTNPIFNFEVDFPGMNEVEKNVYISIINQNLNYNFLTLLVVNSFYNPGVSVGGSNSSTASNTSMLGNIPSEVLSNQMSNWLSQISKDVDIGVNYRPGDQLTQDELEVALSTQISDIIRIEGNVGMGGGSVNSSTKNSSNIVGDVNVEVKLTDNVKLHVYNKSNQQDYLINDVPYTQGVGVFYQKEFNTFKELFRRKKHKKKKEKKEPTE